MTILAAVPPAALSPGPRPDAALYAEARRQLAAVRVTAYQHVPLVDEATGTYRYDCSGFFAYALGRVSPGALQRLTPRGAPRLKAGDVVDALRADSSDWRRLSVDQLGPGDVLAWRRPVTLDSRNSGHVMVVSGRPSQNARGEWIVPVIDSASSRHGEADPRPEAGGLGEGAVVLVIRDGRPVAYRWSPLRRSRKYETEIVLARLLSLS